MGKKEEKLKKLSELDIHLYDDHKLPSTRREFLSSGLLGLSTFALGGASLLSKNAYADLAACQELKTCGVPFLSFEGAGGMNIAGGNVMVGFDSDEDQLNFGTLSLTDYIRLGLPATMHPSRSGMINQRYGLAFHSTSGLFQGLEEVLTPAESGDPDYRKSIDGIILCTRTGDDSPSNPINAAFQASHSGGHGQLIQLVGNSNTANGARSATIPSQVDMTKRSGRIARFADGEGLLSLGGNFMGGRYLASSESGGMDRVKGFLQRIINMGSYDLDKLKDTKENTEEVKKVLGKSKGLFDKFNPAMLNPEKNGNLAQVQSAFGGTGDDVDDESIASIANLVIDRVAGVGSVTVGGCDYHNGSASSGQRKDKEIGRYIGKCIKLAALRGENLFIHLYTDGGVVAPGGGTIDESLDGGGRVIWSSDSGTRSSQVILVYKHGHDRDTDGAILLRDKSGYKKRQVGHYNKAGGVNLVSTSISNSVENIWKGVILNYLAASSTETDDDKVISFAISEFKRKFPRETLPDDAEKLIRIKSLVA